MQAGLGQEDSGMIIEGMAQQGAEPTYCMGDDIPLSVLSDKPHMLYDYFKQRFAQVLLCSALQPILHASWSLCLACQVTNLAVQPSSDKCGHATGQSCLTQSQADV